MSSILVINAAGRETRVALVENGHIAEFYLERKKDKGVVGNIYKGRVVRVLPGMQAAFVDIGLEKAAFLYVSDVVYDPDFARAQFELTEGEHDDQPEVPEVVEGELTDPAASPAEASASQPSDADASAAPPSLEASAPALSEVPSAQDAAAPGQQEAVAAASESVSSPEPTSQEAVAAPVSAWAPPERSESESSSATAALEAPSDAAAPSLDAASPGVMAAPADAGPSAGAIAGIPELPSATPASSLDTAAPPATTEGSGERRAPREQRERTREKPRRRDEREKRNGRDGREGRDGRGDEEKPKPRGKMSKIEDLLKVGQEVVVQISKDPIGTKGARLTSHISIPGRHLVFMPTVDHVGISRRIGNEKERRRLREIVDRMRPPGTGFIVRTVAENVPQEKLESDIRFRLAAMVPPPRAHLVRYHGCLAPNAKMRPAVVPKRGAPTQAPQSQDKGAAAMGGRLDWATLLRRVYAVDVLQCPKCQGKLKVLAFLSDGPTVKKVLAHLGLPAEVAPLAPPRYAPEQLHLEPPYAGERAVGDSPASGPSCSQGPPSRLLLAA